MPGIAAGVGEPRPLRAPGEPEGRLSPRDRPAAARLAKSVVGGVSKSSLESDPGCVHWPNVREAETGFPSNRQGGAAVLYGAGRFAATAAEQHGSAAAIGPAAPRRFPAGG